MVSPSEVQPRTRTRTNPTHHLQSETLPSTLPALLRHAASLYPDQPAVVDGEVRMDYTQLLERSQAVARGLLAQGVQPGDRVAIWAPNLH